jgi:hypothetical protein
MDLGLWAQFAPPFRNYSRYLDDTVYDKPFNKTLNQDETEERDDDMSCSMPKTD